MLGRPLHRIVAALRHDGLDVAEGTLVGALKTVSGLLAPLDAAIQARNAAAAHLHVDETSWSVFEAVADKVNHRWWLWVFVAADTTVFSIEPSRSTKVLTEHLHIDLAAGAVSEGRRLLMSSDFFTVYQALATVDGVDPLWCWAHIRRYFIRAGDAHKQLRAWTHRMAGADRELYAAHTAMTAAEPGSGDHRYAAAQFSAALNSIDAERRARAGRPGLHPAAAKVLATLDHEWEGLARHKQFPQLPLATNAAERALRNPVVGPKNLLRLGIGVGRRARRAGLERHRNRHPGRIQPAVLPHRLPGRLRRGRSQAADRRATDPVLLLGVQPHRPGRMAGQPARARTVTAPVGTRPASAIPVAVEGQVLLSGRLTRLPP